MHQLAPTGALSPHLQGLKAALDAAVRIKGLLEMMFDVITDWVHDFICDVEAVDWQGTPTPRTAPATRRVSSAGGRPRAGLWLPGALAWSAVEAGSRARVAAGRWVHSGRLQLLQASGQEPPPCKVPGMP